GDASSTLRLTSVALALIVFISGRPRKAALFPYTTLFRSRLPGEMVALGEVRCRAGGFGVEPGGGDRVAGALVEVRGDGGVAGQRSEEHTSELQSRENLVCRLLLEKKKKARICTE